MATIIDEIKERLDIVDLVSGDVDLRRSGKNYTGFCPFHSNTRTPALVVFPDTQTWRCFGACDSGGTVIDWVLQQNPGWDIHEAIRELAKRARIPLENRNDGPALAQRIAERKRETALQVAARLFARWLLEDEQALAYVRGRGLNDETIKASGIGFSGRATAAQVDEMRGEFSMHSIDPESPQAAIVLGYRGDMDAWCEKWGITRNAVGKRIHGMMSTPGVVFPHRVHGRVVYLSRRQLPGHDRGGEWKSYNPPTSLAGSRVPFFNHLYRRGSGAVAIVEGQFCAITLAQWGISAMALAGPSWSGYGEYFDEIRSYYETVYLIPDRDEAGEMTLRGKRGGTPWPMADVFGPMLWVVELPEIAWEEGGRERRVGDTNDLRRYYAHLGLGEDEERAAVEDVFSAAAPIVLHMARWAGERNGAVRQQALERVVPMIARMPTTARNDYRVKLARALFPDSATMLQEYNKLVGDEIKRGAGEDGEGPLERVETMGGWFPEEENSGWLLDVIYDREADRTRFAYVHIVDLERNVREVGVADFLDIGETRYVPLCDDNIRFGTIILPSDLGPLKPTKELLAIIEFFLRRYFLLDEETRYKLSAVYALFTWVYDAFEALNFLRARGGSGSGKSDLMYLIGLVSYRLMVTLAVTSTASYKGLAHLYRGTLFIDEAQDLMQEDRGMMRALLKGRATKRFAHVVNMVEVMSPNGRVFAPSSSLVYGPTLITMYGKFKDAGIENRCVSFDLSQKDTIELLEKNIEPGYIPPELGEEAEKIRNMLLRWRLETWRPKIELSAEERKKYRLADPLVSPRVNQVMRPLKVLAVLERDFDLLDDLMAIGRANYEDEMIARAGSFEAVILRAVVAVDENEAYREYIYEGKLGRYGHVRYVLYKDLAKIANEILDAENLADAADENVKKAAVKPRTVGEICREAFRMPVFRTHRGWVVILDREKIRIGRLRFGLDREDAVGAPLNSDTDKGGVEQLHLGEGTEADL